MVLHDAVIALRVLSQVVDDLSDRLAELERRMSTGQGPCQVQVSRRVDSV